MFRKRNKNTTIPNNKRIPASGMKVSCGKDRNTKEERNATIIMAKHIDKAKYSSSVWSSLTREETWLGDVKAK